MTNEVELDFDTLYTEWRTTQKLLAHVLYVTGPVRIPTAQLVAGIPEGFGIEIYKQEQTDMMVVQLGETNE